MATAVLPIALLGPVAGNPRLKINGKFDPERPEPVEPKPSSRLATIVRIPIILPHMNADNLVIIPINGLQFIARVGQFKIGDLGVFIQAGSVVPQTEPFRFIWEPKLDSHGWTSDRERRIEARKFRQELSEGLLLPLSDFPELTNPESSFIAYVQEGYDVSNLLGIRQFGTEDHPIEKTPTKLSWILTFGSGLILAFIAFCCLCVLLQN